MRSSHNTYCGSFTDSSTGIPGFEGLWHFRPRHWIASSRAPLHLPCGQDRSLDMAAFLFAPPEPPTYSIDSLSGKLAVVGGVPCLVLEADMPAGAQICILYAHGNAVDIGQIVAMMRKIQFVLMKRAEISAHIIAVE